MTPAEIAHELLLSVNTVRSHVQRMLTKLNVHSTLEAPAFGPPSRHTSFSSQTIPSREGRRGDSPAHRVREVSNSLRSRNHGIQGRKCEAGTMTNCAGVVGFGSWGPRHARFLRLINNGELGDICYVDTARLNLGPYPPYAT